MYDLTLEQLKQAVRDAEYLADLKHLVGPSDEDYNASQERKKQMKNLCDKAFKENWGTNALEWPAPYSSRFEQLFTEQQQYNSQYSWG